MSKHEQDLPLDLEADRNTVIFEAETDAGTLRVEYFDRPAANFIIKYQRQVTEVPAAMFTTPAQMANEVVQCGKWIQKQDQQIASQLAAQFADQIELDGTEEPSFKQNPLMQCRIDPIECDGQWDAGKLVVEPQQESVWASARVNPKQSARSTLILALDRIVEQAASERQEALMVLAFRIQNQTLTKQLFAKRQASSEN